MKVKIAISEPAEVTDPLITDLSSYIAKSKRAIVVTGAGISCSSGIPVRIRRETMRNNSN
jgi:NAD-dependent histone deacetylase SIR2